MNKLYTFLCASICCFSLQAQTVMQVNSGTDLFIKSGTSFYVGGLVLEPSIDYTLNGYELTSHATTAHFTVNNYAAIVVRFSQPAPAFSGTLHFHYADGLLNSIPEANLALNVHNDNYWQAISTASRNPVENFITTDPVSNIVLSEFALSDQMHLLPVVWGGISAQRQGIQVKVNWHTLQEDQVAHFIVQRSNDGINWQTVSTTITARNLPTEQAYQYIDYTAPMDRVYYRIRQQDFNGTVQYSSTMTVAGNNDPALLQVYPNPAQHSFRLLQQDARTIQKIELYNSSGALVQTWAQTQNLYDIRGLANGSYHVVLHLNNGLTQHLKLQKN